MLRMTAMRAGLASICPPQLCLLYILKRQLWLRACGDEAAHPFMYSTRGTPKREERLPPDGYKDRFQTPKSCGGGGE